MCQYSSADQEITYQLPQILANYLQNIMSSQINSSTSQSPPLHTIMSKKAMGRSSSFYRQCQFFGSLPQIRLIQLLFSGRTVFFSHNISARTVFSSHFQPSFSKPKGAVRSSLYCLFFFLFHQNLYKGQLIRGLSPSKKSRKII